MLINSNPIHDRNNQGFTVSTDKSRLDISLIHYWLANESYWSREIPFRFVLRSIENSLCFGLYTSAGDQVGFGRVVTDFTAFAWLSDVFILKDYRGLGLGKFLLTCIFNHPELRVLRRWMLGTEDAHDLYKKFGFMPLDHPERFMTIHRGDMYRRDAHKDLLDSFN